VNARFLTSQERDRLAVLRVVAMAAAPDAVKVQVWLTDLLVLLEVVDRLMQAPLTETHAFGTGAVGGSYIAGEATVHNHLAATDVAGTTAEPPTRAESMPIPHEASQ
jgi:hypothetical protein